MNLTNIASEVAGIYSGLQQEICLSLSESDGKAKFTKNYWEKEIGHGLTCDLRDGKILEKGGVNFSFVQGDFTPHMEQLLGEKAVSYAVTGFSSIMHPVNPFVPIIHMNVRFFVLDNGTCWFGGGIDLTPHYIDVPEATNFHKKLKNICDAFDADYYQEFKQKADDYFYLPHRGETRGIGGIFFDRLKPDASVGFEQLLAFTTSIARSYPQLYGQIIRDKYQHPYDEKNKGWQELRRGRYAEFNLAYDRGTKFGFESNGNAESILISLPPTAAWEYKHSPGPDSPEQQTMQFLRKEIDWINL